MPSLLLTRLPIPLVAFVLHLTLAFIVYSSAESAGPQTLTLTASLALARAIVDLPTAVLVVPMVFDTTEEITKQSRVELSVGSSSYVVGLSRDGIGRSEGYGDEAEEGEGEAHCR